MRVLNLDPCLKDALWSHLLPSDCMQEQAAFLYCTTLVVNASTTFKVIDTAFLEPNDFASQCSDYLELSNATRMEIIKRAHKLNASLVELHSHPGPWPAAFSFADRQGLKDTVPHMKWRLKGRPYLAIVVAPSGYDALLWPYNSKTPKALSGIQVGDALMEPTNASLEGWNDERH